MNPVKTLFNVKPLFTNIMGKIPLHEGFVKSVLEECRQQQNLKDKLPSLKLSNPERENAKPVEEFFIGSPNKRASLLTEKAPSSPRTLILKGPSGTLHAKGRERSRRRLFAQHRRAAELDAKHEKEMQEFRLRLEESTRLCRDLRTHLEREADHLERRDRAYRKGLELRKEREERELKLCTFKPIKPTPVPASNKPINPRTEERRLCRQKRDQITSHRKPKSSRTTKVQEHVIEDSTTDESNTSSARTICWVRPTLSFSAAANLNA